MSLDRDLKFLAVDARYVAVEIVLASEVAAANVAWETRWKAALIAHVSH